MNRLLDALQRVKTLESTIDEFMTEHGDEILFEREGSSFSLRPASTLRLDLLPSLEVTSKDIQLGLQKFLDSEIKPEELRAWAAFLILCEVFEFKGNRGR